MCSGLLRGGTRRGKKRVYKKKKGGKGEGRSASSQRIVYLLSLSIRLAGDAKRKKKRSIKKREKEKKEFQGVAMFNCFYDDTPLHFDNAVDDVIG